MIDLLDRASLEPHAVNVEARATLLSSTLTEEERCETEQALALSYSSLGDIDRYGIHAARALRIAEGLGGQSLAHALATICHYFFLAGDNDQFEKHLQRGLRFADGYALARLLNAAGNRSWMSGELVVAEEQYRRSLSLFLSDKPQIPALKNNLAIVLMLLGKFNDAEQLFRESLDAGSRYPILVAKCEMNLSLLTMAQGRIAEGSALFEAAQRKLDLLGLDPVPARVDQCRMLVDLGLPALAVEAGFALLEGLREKRPEIRDLLSVLYPALLLTGDYASARRLLQFGEDSSLDSLGPCRSLQKVLDGEVLSSETKTLLEECSQRVLLLVAADLLLAERGEAFQQVVRAISPQNPFEEAFSQLLIAGSSHDDLVPSLRSIHQTFGQDSKSSFDDRVWIHRVEKLAMRSSLRRNDPSAALLALSLRSVETDIAASRDNSPEWTALLQQRRILASGEYQDAYSKRRLDEIDRSISTLFASAATSRRAPLDDFICEHMTLVFQTVGDRVASLFFGPDTEPEVKDLCSLDALTAAVRRCRVAMGQMARGGPNLVDNVQRWQKSCVELDALVLQPWNITSNDLRILPTNDLADVSWSALPSLAHRRHRVAEVPLPHGTTSAPLVPNALLAHGPNLAHTERELEAICSVIPSAVCLVDSLATADAVLDRFGGFSIVHIGAHGTIRRGEFLFSELELSGGSLLLGELARLPTLPSLLVLSACHLGSSLTSAGGEQWSFLSSLSGKGCGSVVMSTTPVIDASVPQFMRDFYAALFNRGVSVASALLHAHEEAAKRNDFGCAGFIEFEVP